MFLDDVLMHSNIYQHWYETVHWESSFVFVVAMLDNLSASKYGHDTRHSHRLIWLPHLLKNAIPRHFCPMDLSLHLFYHPYYVVFWIQPFAFEANHRRLPYRLHLSIHVISVCKIHPVSHSSVCYYSFSFHFFVSFFSLLL